ncbi:MAG: nucleoside triphosphate pyrophosphohydrolase [Desulfobacterales bacterium]
MEENQINYKITKLKRLIELIETLRGENGCPWDKTQTAKTMAIYLLEEVYELVDALETENPDEICEELGDVLFHIFFMARLFEEKGAFDIGDVAGLNKEKMIRRHPHVFGSESAKDAGEVRKRWHTIKKSEKKHMNHQSVLDSVPGGLPALMRAYRISERAARTGFDWDNIDGVMKKAEEEWSEFQCALNKNNKNDISVEFGDILFTLVNVARFAAIHPETALKDSIKKFETRFRNMEKKVAESGRNLDSASRNELDMLWEEVKKA